MTRAEKLLRRIKNNKLASIAIVFGVVVIALSSFTDALVKLSAVFSGAKESRRAKAETMDAVSSGVKKEPGKARVEISDILVLDPDIHGRRFVVPYALLKLDFRVHNAGGQAASISRVRFKDSGKTSSRYMRSQPPDIIMVGVSVLPEWLKRLEQEDPQKALGASAGYDLDLTNFSGVAEVAVSHTLEPGETDRFIIKAISRRREQLSLKPSLVTSSGIVEAAPITLNFILD